MTSSKQTLLKKINALEFALAIPKEKIVIELKSEQDGIDLLGRMSITLIKDGKLFDDEGYEFDPQDIYAEEDVQKILRYLL